MTTLMPEHASVHITGSCTKKLLGNLGKKELLSLSGYFLISGEGINILKFCLVQNVLHIRESTSEFVGY